MTENSDVSILNQHLFSPKQSGNSNLGLEHLHIGWYKEQKDHLELAALNIIERMDRLIPRIKKSSKILILGSRYGSAARYLVDKYGCKVDCVHQNKDQMKIAQSINEGVDFQEKILSVHAPLSKIPFPRETYDTVWSQDQFFCVNQKMQLFREVYRVLKPEGRFIFTDIMQSDDYSNGTELPKVGIPFEDIFSEEKYQRMASRVDFEPVFKRLLTDSFRHHLSSVKQHDENLRQPILFHRRVDGTLQRKSS